MVRFPSVRVATFDIQILPTSNSTVRRSSLTVTMANNKIVIEKYFNSKK